MGRTSVLGSALALAFVFSLLAGCKDAAAPAAQAAVEAAPYPGYTLIPIDGAEEVRLVDAAGKTVHIWPVDATRARLLSSGNLLVIHGSKWGSKQPKWKRLRSVVREYDWNGKIVWEYKARDFVHHDIQRLKNGNTIFLVRDMVPESVRQAKIRDPRLRELKVRSDDIIEVNPKGEIVWEWRAREHLDLNRCGAKGCRAGKKTSSYRDWTHMNTVQEIPDNRLFREGHAAFKPGNIMTLARNLGTVYIIDKESKEVVWEHAGGPYKGGMGGGHEPQIIPEGFPGAGNLLLFDNGRKTHPSASFILEIDPLTRENVWIYDDGKNFRSRARGSVQRLANGNTLISEDNRGRCFEVSADGKIVWEYKVQQEIDRCIRYPLHYVPQLAAFAGN